MEEQGRWKCVGLLCLCFSGLFKYAQGVREKYRRLKQRWHKETRAKIVFFWGGWDGGHNVFRLQKSVVYSTVIDFPLGSNSLQSKIKEAEIAINDGVKELDFVCDYNTFKMGNYKIFDESIFECTKFALSNKVIVKWIIETGALSKVEIKLISERIYNIVLENFPEKILKVFIKTSTGYYGGYGATIMDVKAIKSVISNMPIKASGGVSDLATCQEMINLGVSRIGTSKALNIYQEYHS